MDDQPAQERLPLPDPTCRLKTIQGFQQALRCSLKEAVDQVDMLGQDAAAEWIRKQQRKEKPNG